MANVKDTNGDGRAVPIDEEGRKTQARLPKKLIVCCDGTWMDANDNTNLPSNVTRIARAIASEDDTHHPQIVYYQAGIGTGIGPVDQLGGGGTGLGLSENIREAYAFLASNYSPNDDILVKPDSIFLIGFSRGAYTARSLGGFITAFGILKKHAMTFFYHIFKDWENAGEPNYKPQFFDEYFKTHADVAKTKPDDALARDQKKRDEYIQQYFRRLQELGLTQDVTIQAIGVFDTVGALGIPVHPFLQKILPWLPAFIREAKWFDTRLDTRIKNAFQALALDEKRFPYSPAVWELRPENGETPTTNLKQVWFPGAHSNVGGSYPDSGIADITLAWMMDQLSGNGSHSSATPPSAPEEWIKFDLDYWHTLYDDRTAFLTKTKPAPYRPWSHGYVYNSNTFPGSLILGAKRRTPGLYHRTIYDTGKPDPHALLSHTNEFIHSCVRARIDTGGRGVEPDAKKAFPTRGLNLRPLLTRLWQLFFSVKPPRYHPQGRDQPLQNWRLVDGHAEHYEDEPARGISMDGGEDVGGKDEVVWVYEGKEKSEKGWMREDRLGGFFERMLLEMRSPELLAQQVEESNNGWKVVTKLPVKEVRASKTI